MNNAGGDPYFDTVKKMNTMPKKPSSSPVTNDLSSIYPLLKVGETQSSPNLDVFQQINKKPEYSTQAEPLK